MRSPDADPDYCEPAFLPGQEAVVVATGEVVMIRAAIPVTAFGRVLMFFYVGDAGAWTGGELVASGGQ